jgi:hypothetical protein
VVVEFQTKAYLVGPYQTLVEAVQAARAFRPGCIVWRENTDERGRSMGPPTRLPDFHKPSQ